MNNIDSKEEELIKAIINSEGVETPSSNFTSKVMDKVKLHSQISFNAKPLVSKIGWFAIVLSTLILIIGGLFTKSSVYFNRLDDISFNFNVSSVLVYASLFFMLMTLVMTYYVKMLYSKNV
jgi:magnesium-transporting ATPase (P-type)